VEDMIFEEKTFAGAHLSHRRTPRTPPNFAEKTFANSYKPQNLRKFSPSKVFRYTVSRPGEKWCRMFWRCRCSNH